MAQRLFLPVVCSDPGILGSLGLGMPALQIGMDNGSYLAGLRLPRLPGQWGLQLSRYCKIGHQKREEGAQTGGTIHDHVDCMGNLGGAEQLHFSPQDTMPFRHHRGCQKEPGAVASCGSQGTRAPLWDYTVR